MELSVNAKRNGLICIGTTLSLGAALGLCLTGNRLVELMGRKIPYFASLSPTKVALVKLGTSAALGIGGVATTVLIARRKFHQERPVTTNDVPSDEPVTSASTGSDSPATNTTPTSNTPPVESEETTDTSATEASAIDLSPMKEEEKGFAYRCAEDNTTYHLRKVLDEAIRCFAAGDPFTSPVTREQYEQITLQIDEDKFEGNLPSDRKQIVLDKNSPLITQFISPQTNELYGPTPKFFSSDGETYNDLDAAREVQGRLPGGTVFPINRAVWEQPNPFHDPLTGERFQDPYIELNTGITYNLSTLREQVEQQRNSPEHRHAFQGPSWYHSSPPYELKLVPNKMFYRMIGTKEEEIPENKTPVVISNVKGDCPF